MVISVGRDAMLCVAAALTCWPAVPSPASRLAALLPRATSSKPTKSRRRDRRRVVLALSMASLVPLLGLAGALAAGLLCAAGRCHRRASARIKAESTAAYALAEAIRMMVAELRAGASPVAAAAGAAADASGPAAAMMKTLAATARLDGDFPVETSGVRTSDQRVLAMAWSLSRRHGLPLAEMLDAVRRDILATARFTARVDASMSGPRTSAAVLAALPVLGLLLGEAMGAQPLHVLTGTVAGQFSLVTGAVLILAGVAWSVRLTASRTLR
jgi:tight adherence protein B